MRTGWIGYAAALGAVAQVSLFIGFVLGQDRAFRIGEPPAETVLRDEAFVR